MHIFRYLIFLFCFWVSILGKTQEVEVPTVVIEGGLGVESPVSPFSIFKTEKVSKKKLKESQRQTLSDLVKDQVGVESQVYCSNCGAKRLTINGLKGEHTSILIDGVPLHSAVSSFYGVDNIPVNGLAEVQVMRGAGASLTNPEAIGGTLNLVTVNPLDVKNQYSTSIGIDDRFYGKTQNHHLLYTLRDKNKRWGVTAGGQMTRAENWDVDKNNIAEMPQRRSYSALLKARTLIGEKHDLSLRLGQSALEILGGSNRPNKPQQVRSLAAQESDFIDGNVEKDFIGDSFQVTDWVNVKRLETALTGTYYVSSSLTYDWKLGFARQEQQAIYQHGFDYSHVDHLFVGDMTFKWALSNQSIFTFGAFFKDQRLRSASEILFEQYPENDARDIKKDSFNFSSYAFYFQYSYLWRELLELDFALRADQLKINWLDLTNKMSKFILAPRFQLLHNISHHLSQRFSYGLGYRAPLTFFESQHGNNESGYEVDISELEKAHSLVYSLSFNKPTYYVTGGLHYTHLENMAYGFEAFNQPIRYRNSEENYDIWVGDLLVGYKPMNGWLLEASVEFFEYAKGYKAKLPTAAIEKRLQLKSSFERGDWSHSFLANIVGARDLSKYGSYPEHYVNRHQSFEPLLDSNLELKNQKSPAYFTIDTSISYQWNQQLILTASIQNLLNYTQAGVGDSPSAWHWHFNHSHYDGLHTWGPNTGRQYFLTMSGEF